jgi:hypothetical protein
MDSSEAWGGVLKGTECECLEEGFGLSCLDTVCLVCSPDSEWIGCLENFDYGVDFTEDGVPRYWKCNMRYVSGRDEEISYVIDSYEKECSMAIDGVQCNSCSLYLCSDGYQSIRMDCSNIEEGAVFDDCDSSLDGGGSPLLYET